VVIDQQDAHGPLAVGARSHRPAIAEQVEFVRHVVALAGGSRCRLRL
jgi:hypothetical protein